MAIFEPWSERFIPPGYVSLGIATLVAVVAPLALHPESSGKIKLRAGDTVPSIVLGHGVNLILDEEELFLVPPMSAVLEKRSRRDGTLLLVDLAESGVDVFRTLLSAGDIRAFVFNADDGARVQVPPHYWNSADAGEVLWKDWPATFEADGKHACGWVIFEHSELASFLAAFAAGLPCSGPIEVPAPAETSAPPGRLERIEATAGSHLPYLAFMLRAEHELGLAPGKRVLKKEIVDWIKKNWPAELGAQVPGKINAMATFLREPKFERGGIPPAQRVAAE